MIVRRWSGKQVVISKPYMLTDGPWDQDHGTSKSNFWGKWSSYKN